MSPLNSATPGAEVVERLRRPGGEGQGRARVAVIVGGDIPVLYAARGRPALLYSGWAQHDHALGTGGQGGLHLVAGHGEALRLQGFSGAPRVLLGQASG